MIDRRKIADILYNVWKSKLSITNGSTEIESMTKAYADAKGKEIAELKASLIQAQQMYTDLLVGTTEAIAAKDAEIKRLRDAMNEAIHHGGYFYANGNGEHHGHGGEKVLNVVGNILTKALLEVAAPQPDIISKILKLPDDTSAAYIKTLITDYVTTP